MKKATSTETNAGFYGDDAMELDEHEDPQFCECNDNPIEDELATGKCFCCGGLLW